MRDSEFKLLDPLADSINDKFEELHKAGSFEGILRDLKKAVARLPDTYSVSFDIRMNVFDTDREKGLSLLTTGFNAQKGHDLYRHYGDTAPQKCLVDGGTCIVPEDYCPHCWGDRGFKFKNTSCTECGYELRKQVKYLLDDDVRPYCQEGKLTIDNPICSKCGYKVDERKVVWG